MGNCIIYFSITFKPFYEKYRNKEAPPSSCLSPKSKTRFCYFPLFFDKTPIDLLDHSIY
jgi:hypothetical protein